MSNPLAAFRKYQKILLVVFGVALMVVFTVGGIVSETMNRQASQSNNPVAVKMKSGDLRESDLQNLRASRFHLRRFMARINEMAVAKGATARQSLEIPNNVDENNLVQTAILSARAEQMGIRVSDDAIIRFLERYTQGTISRGEFAQILGEVTQRRMPQNQFFAAMRRELLALRYLSLFQRGMLPSTPTAAWDYFQRLNRRITFEAVPFETRDYLSQVAEPKDTEIAALYAEAKDRYPIPSSPEVGLKRLKKVSLQYVKGDLSTFMTAAKSQITDEQVAAYYEENKEKLYRNISLPDFGGTSLDDSTSDTVDSLNLDGAAIDPDATEIDPLDKTQPSPKDDTEPAEEFSTDTLDLEPADDEAAQDGLEPINDQPNDQSSVSATTVTLPVGQTQEAATEDGTDAAQTDREQDAANEDGGNDDGENEDDTVELETDDDLTTDRVESDDLETDVIDDDSADPTDEPDPLADLPEAAGGNVTQEPDYKSLDEVADSIRETLATPIARQTMDKAMNDVRSRMRQFYQSHRGWELSVARESTPAPTPPDIRPVANELSLTLGTVPLVTVYELLKNDPVTNEPLYEISRAYSTSPTFIPFYQRAYDEDLRRFEPQAIQGQVLDTEYLFWKTGEEPERTPKLDEVRAEIVDALKRDQALELAKKDAAAAAARIQSAGQRPTDLYRNDANRKVVTAPSVSWMNSGAIPGRPPQLATIDGIDYAGDDFMKSVFALHENESGVAVDEPKNTAYVVSVISVDSDNEELKNQFMKMFASSPANETLFLAQRDNQTYMQQWYQSLEKELGIEWERDPTAN